MKTTCPRCGQQATVTFSRRGTERIHTHKRADGTRCTSSWADKQGDARATGSKPSPERQSVSPGGGSPRAGRDTSFDCDRYDEDEDGSPLDGDNDPDT